MVAWYDVCCRLIVLFSSHLFLYVFCLMLLVVGLRIVICTWIVVCLLGFLVWVLVLMVWAGYCGIDDCCFFLLLVCECFRFGCWVWSLLLLFACGFW